MTQVKIDVHYVTRIEGHGNLILDAKDGKIEKLLWEVPESPRFFEAMLVGRHYDDVHHIASRICGICSISHTTASIQATEAAFGIKPSEQTILLRKLLFDAEMLESHVLHTLFLIAPDFLGVDSVIPLAATHPDVVVMALRMKKLAYNLAEALAQRKTHPLSCVVGGFTKVPDLNELKALKKRLVECLKDLDVETSIFKTLKIPDFIRQTEYIALKDPKEYAWISGQIASSDAPAVPIDKYLGVTNEFCVPTSTAKYTKNKRDSYMVGALARFNLNSKQLSPRAKAVAKELGISAPCFNPYMISVAQLVETYHVVEDSINLIDQLVERGVKEEPDKVKPKAGRGVGAVEAPRGILFHDYTYDANGIITKANCIIPTNQNHNNIQKDLEALVPKILDKPQAEIQKMMEMLVRAYDPCVSCSTHALTVTFK
ncbi:MAG TPA: Ni/Fe hydrogenase subunit alpha [Dehalococcoidales bacterium]